jgi:hypothetical protein
MRYLTPLNYLATFAGSILGFVMGILAYRVAYEVGGWILFCPTGSETKWREIN